VLRVWDTELHAELHLHASAPGHVAVARRFQGRSRITLDLDAAREHEVVLHLPAGISPRSVTAVLTKAGEDFHPNDVRAEEETWRGRWGRAPEGKGTLRVLAKCPVRVLDTVTIDVDGTSTALRPRLETWTEVAVAFPRYRHWGVYVTSLDASGPLTGSEVTPHDRLIVRPREKLLFFGPELLGQIREATPPRVEVDFVACPTVAVEGDGSDTMRVYAECVHEAFRDPASITLALWATHEVLRETSTVADLLLRLGNESRITFPLPYDVAVQNAAGEVVHRQRIEPPYEPTVTIRLGDAPSGR